MFQDGKNAWPYHSVNNEVNVKQLQTNILLWRLVCTECTAINWNVEFYISGALMPYFPENVDNATIQIGQSAEMKCTVENLNNYKVNSKISSI